MKYWLRYHGWLWLGLALLAWGIWQGIFVAPKERMMGDVYRIMFVHVPSAWITLLAYTCNLVACLWYLSNGSRKADSIAEAAGEVGVVLNLILLLTGSLWGRPTWGVYWSWDPRLTTAAIMFFGYAGWLSLRRFIQDPLRRATVAAVVGVLIYANIPIVWFSVKWWNSLHQLQSSPATMDKSMVLPLRINAFAFLSLALWFGQLRTAIGSMVWAALDRDAQQQQGRAAIHQVVAQPLSKGEPGS